MHHSEIAKCPAIALSFAAALMLAIGSASPAAATPPETGIWYDDTGKGAVKIEICGNTLCGKIYWLKEPRNAKGEQLTDKYNPEPTMRARPICGLPVLGDLEQMSEGGFDNGWVYDPKEGKSYSVALDLVAADKLQVTGYKGVRFLGKSFIWTRAPDNLPSCETTTAAAPGKSGEAAPTNKKAAAAGGKKPTGSDAKTATAKTPAAKASATKVGSANSKTPAAKTTKAAPTQQPPVASN